MGRQDEVDVIVPYSWCVVVFCTAGACEQPRSSPVPPAPAPVVEDAAGVSFRRDVLPYLAKNCSADEGCHGAKPTDSVHLDLRADAAWTELVKRESPVRKGAFRVEPGDPSKSFLVDKLTQKKLRRGEGKSMPLDPDTGVSLPPSAAQSAFADGVLVPWIIAGAPNNSHTHTLPRSGRIGDRPGRSRHSRPELNGGASPPDAGEGTGVGGRTARRPSLRLRRGAASDAE